MVIGVLQFEVLIHDPESLKDKRRVVNSLKDRLHREHQASVAEVLDRISAKLHSMTHARIGDIQREIIQSGQEGGHTTLADVDMRRVPGAGPDASDRTWAIDEPPRPPRISKEELDDVFGPRTARGDEP